MVSSFENSLLEELEKLKEENLYRYRIVLPQKGLKVLCSNNYLNLSNHPEVKEKVIQILKEFPAGSGASQLVSGYTLLHKELEEYLAQLKGVESCVIFGSGYLANIGVIGALFGKEDTIFSDQLNHASIIDGVRLSRAQKFIYPHGDIQTLKKLLEEHRHKYRRCGIVTDSVFSMDGDIAPLKELNLLAKNFECALIIDDAHATGTIGFSSLEYFGIKPEGHIIQVGTFSKALGSYGAFVCGSKVLTRYLVNKARSLIFSTSLPPPVVSASLVSLKVLKENPSLISSLQRKAKFVKELLIKEGFNLGVSLPITPIVPIIFESEDKTLRVRDCLLKKGFFVQAIRYPTVERGKARLRLTVTLEHSLEIYEQFIEILKKCV
ncbi:MAG: 8-amino-7-oxononanoate synthase [Aquificaceae bacterium]|nr:MAG: 8-amino-7-oxononanoate synthase [Aquificaceae bacterium]